MADDTGMIGLDEANKAFDAYIASREETATTDSSATDAQRAEQAADTAKVQSETITDTPAAAEDKAQGETLKAEDTAASLEADAQGQNPNTKDQTPNTKEEGQKVEDKSSKFAKDAARRDTSWKALNAEKTQFQSDRAAFEAEREAFKAEREAATEETTVTPEKYKAFSANMQMRADHLTAEADRLEKTGKYDEAEAKREEARDCIADVRKANRMADELAKNPPPGPTQRQAKLDAAKREWTLKSAQDFPDLAKEGSEFQTAVGRNYADLKANAPAMYNDPKSIYFVTKLTAAEAASARVPAMEKELSQMKARVKELEALTSPGDAGQPTRLNGTVPWEQRSRADQEPELLTMANGLMLR
jgi:hypothetical protein